MYANATTAELLGYSGEQLIKMKLPELLPEPMAQLHQRFIKGRGALPGWPGCEAVCDPGGVLFVCK